MSRSLIAYAITFVVFGAIDFAWLGFVAKDIYLRGIGHLMRDAPYWPAAIGWRRTLTSGGLFGFFCYATYDLTNWATLTGWPGSVVAADLAYGTIASGVACAIACAATLAIAPTAR